ncbi:MAG: NAD-dependent epimerase/dehydratase family protein [Chloroflexi bacterium]|nr:MAG: NAD-dependent epimerase/dehydratase family protein [Chloroflexota bacterium]
MRVGITGGAGFIGSHVVDALVSAGHDVTVIDVKPPHRPEPRHVAANLLDSQALLEAVGGLEAVYHLAAVADVNDVNADPAAAIDLNVTGTLRVLEACRANAVRRVILASTVWVYSSVAPTEADIVSETEPFAADAGRHIYTTSKIAAEMLCHDYWNMHGLPFTILRYGIPYGPRMRLSLVVPVFVRKALAGEPLTVAGDGLQHRKFVYVEDLARGHVLALGAKAENQTYNLDGAEKITILRIAETVLRLTGSSEAIQFTEARSGDYSGKDVSSEKARRELGWAPEIGFDEGMQRTVPWLIERLKEERDPALSR